MEQRLFIGVLSGTSIDAIDAVIVDLASDIPKVIASHSHAIPHLVQKHLQTLCQSPQGSLDDIGKLDLALGTLFAQAIQQLLKKARISAKSIEAIGSHGQNIRHCPEDNFTLQIGNPHVITQITGITTVADFRRSDVALGGQGAPLSPIFHEHCFRHETITRAILNLGGIANITLLKPGQPTQGFDTGPANTLMDRWVHQHKKLPYDHMGEWASSGSVHALLLEHLLKDSYFSKQPPKSTGREYFNIHWLEGYLKGLPHSPKAEDVQSTLAALTAKSVKLSLEQSYITSGELYICGGGIHNQHLMGLLQKECQNFTVMDVENLGINADWLEAVLFAWLAKQAMEGKKLDLRAITGASKATNYGIIYPA